MQTQAKPFSWLIAAALSFFTLHLNAQEAPVLESPSVEYTTAIPVGPITEIEFETSTYDFGAIEESEIVSHVFTFTNVGQQPLIITDAKGSCGCTVPQWPREAIAPGETASITVKFNSKNKKGKRNQKVTITANTNPPQNFVYLAGEVIPRENTAEKEVEKIDEKAQTALSRDCFAIYPNPTAEVLKLDIEESNLGESAMISIYAPTGQLMAKREVLSIEGPIEFNVSHYPADTYIAQVQIGDHKPESRCFVVID